jgi:hypothetical protein
MPTGEVGAAATAVNAEEAAAAKLNRTSAMAGAQEVSVGHTRGGWSIERYYWANSYVTSRLQPHGDAENLTSKRPQGE